MSSDGTFIAFEGLDGAGTSTQLNRLAAWLQERGVSVEVTREPSNAPFGAVIRQAIEGRIHLHPRALALAFAGDREDHLTNDVNGILNALDRGSWVLCDRYVLSSLAYQTSDEVEFDWLVELNRHMRVPDATVFVDTPVEICMQRIAARSAHSELFHRATELERVADNYRRAIDHGQLVGELIKVSGNAPPDAVFAALMEQLRPWLTRVEQTV